MAARQAVDLLHHFADFVCKEPDPALPAFKTPNDVRNAVRPLCVFTRTTIPVDDVSLLMDVADAFKHHRPDRKSATVDVSFAITTSYGGYGELRYREGNTAAPSRSSSPGSLVSGAPCRRSFRTSSTPG